MEKKHITINYKLAGKRKNITLHVHNVDLIKLCNEIKVNYIINIDITIGKGESDYTSQREIHFIIGLIGVYSFKYMNNFPLSGSLKDFFALLFRVAGIPLQILTSSCEKAFRVELNVTFLNV